jgi:hypothetical protein
MARTNNNLQFTADQQTQANNAKQHDGLLHLSKSLNIHPDVLIGDGNGILATGMPGAGKTTLMALLFEQFGLCDIPFAIFDLEGDLASIVELLPRGVLATAGNCPTVKEMYQDGLQVVFDIASWAGDDAAIMLSTMTDNLMKHARSLPAHLRVPFVVGLDEAAYWLPQSAKGKNYLTDESFRIVFNSFHTLAIRGRKNGVVPALFTQRFAEVHKDVLSPGTYILMKHTTDTDLRRYMEYISTAAFTDANGIEPNMRQIRSRIQTFRKGQAIVRLANGTQKIVQFNNRQSEHTSHAPKTQAAVNAYRSVNFTPGKSYGAFLPDSELANRNVTVDVVTQPNEQATGQEVLVLKKKNINITQRGVRTGAASRIRELLTQQPDLTTSELARLVGCHNSLALRVRKAAQE